MKCQSSSTKKPKRHVLLYAVFEYTLLPNGAEDIYLVVKSWNRRRRIVFVIIILPLQVILVEQFIVIFFLLPTLCYDFNNIRGITPSYVKITDMLYTNMTFLTNTTKKGHTNRNLTERLLSLSFPSNP